MDVRMIDGDTPDERLVEARRLFENAYDHHADWLREAEEDIDFYHGHQWPEEDIEYLNEQKRPVLTFNVLQSKVHHMLGAAEDNDVSPVVLPRGEEDQFLADALNKLREQVYEMMDGERVEDQIFEDGVAAGIGNGALDAFADPADPSKLKLRYDRVHPLEVIWDPACERRDKSDAKYLVWSRWFSKSEFKQNYPEHAGEADDLFQRYSGGDAWHREHITDTTTNLQTSPYHDGYMPRRSNLYYDSKRHEMRVIHLEVVKAVKSTMAVAADGRRRLIDPAMKAVLREQFGPSIRFVDYWQEKHFWYEFVGVKMLYEDESPLPFDGFSITPFVFKANDNNLPYGIVRLLKDPQREVNKRYSQVLLMIMGQSAPGVIAETDAFVDEDQAKESLKRPGDITWAKSGAMAAGRIQERQIPVFPESVARLQDIALRMIDIISNVHVDDLMEPRGIPEAAATTQLKHRRSLLSMKPLLRSWHWYKKEIALKVLQSIVNSMPDEQVTELLGFEERFTTRGRMIVDNKTGTSASLRQMRQVRLNIRLEPNQVNNTERLLELQSLSTLQQNGIPIAPDVLFDMMAVSDDKRTRLKEYATQMTQQALQTEQENLKQTQQQLDRVFAMEQIDRQLQGAELQQRDREMQLREGVRMDQIEKEYETRLLDLWLKSDMNEKQLITSVIQEVLRSQKERGVRGEETKKAGGRKG